MKNSRREAEFTKADFESFLLWKVFWKMIRADSPYVFFLKVLGCGAFLIAMILLMCLTSEIARSWG